MLPTDSNIFVKYLMTILKTHFSFLQIQQNKMKQNGLGNKLFDRTRYQKCPLCVINGPQTKTIGTMRKGYVSYCGQNVYHLHILRSHTTQYSIGYS